MVGQKYVKVQESKVHYTRMYSKMSDFKKKQVVLEPRVSPEHT